MNLRSRDRIVGNAELARRLCVVSVNLGEAHARHVKLHGNLIPHVFMGEVLARAGACASAGNDRFRRAEVAEILATLELGLAGGDRETCSVICISFVWDAEDEPFFADLRLLMGPRLGSLTRAAQGAEQRCAPSSIQPTDAGR